MKTFGFTDTNDFAEFLADTFDKLDVCTRDYDDDCSEIVVVAKYDVMKDVLNSVIKNTNFKLAFCNDLNDPYWDGYDDAFILSIDSEMNVWVQAAKYEGSDTYINMDETDIVFIHGDVSSAFVMDNKDSGCIIHEFNIGEDAEDVDDDCDGNCKNCSCSDVSDNSHKNITFDKDENGKIHGFTSVKSDVNGYEKREFYSSKPIDLSDFDEYNSVGRLFDLLDFIF